MQYFPRTLQNNLKNVNKHVMPTVEEQVFSVQNCIFSIFTPELGIINRVQPGDAVKNSTWDVSSMSLKMENVEIKTRAAVSSLY